MQAWKAHLTRTCSGEGASLSRWLLFFRSGMKPPLESSHNSGYVSRVTPPREHNRHICKCYVTYLLIEW